MRWNVVEGLFRVALAAAGFEPVREGDRHEGPYQKLGETYRGVCGQWLPTSGEEARSAPALEYYRNSPMDTPPEKLLTDVCMPLG